MARSTAKLTVVHGDRLDMVEPEEALADLFAREAAAQRALRDVREHLVLARARYAAKHGLLIWPGFETLRRLFA